MTDVKRIQELILTVGQRAALGSPLHEDEAEAVNAALSELARIKGAALSAPEIEQAHLARVSCIEYRREIANQGISESERIWAVNDLENMDTPEHRDRAVLLDALRAKEVECENLKAGGNLLDQVNRAIGKERDAARAQLAQAQKEIERLLDCKRPGTLVEPGCGQCVACLRGLYQDANDRAEERRDAAKKSRHLEEQLAQAERDKAAMRERIEALPIHGYGHPVYVAALRRSEVLGLLDTPRDHGAQGPREGEVVVTNCLHCGNGITKHLPGCHWYEDKPAGAEILAAHRCDCATKPVNLASVCDPCKNSLPEGLWLRFVASELPQRLEAAAEIERILKARAAHRDAKTEPSK